MARSVTLTGITWNHTRGYVPMEATAQRFMDEHPHVEIAWQKRSLKDFGDFPIQRLAERFDLLIIDHPFAGYAAVHPVLVPLDEHLPADYLADQEANSVGASFASYVAGGHLWALPVDTATPVSGYRPDLLEKHGAAVPDTWDDLLALARRGLVAVPAAAVDSLMNLYMLCLALGEEPFQLNDEIVDREIGIAALELLGELVDLCGLENIDRNPIRTWESLSRTDRYVYCPFAYGYSNYGRADYTDHRLQSGGLVTLNGKRLRSTLGGTGLAVSSRCQEIETAVAYAAYVASPSCQSGLYTLTGGQPGHRAAWLDPFNNQLCNGFFEDTLPTLDDAYLRPRYSGYIPFQDHAGDLVRDYLRDGGDAGATFERINALYRESRMETAHADNG
jgi:multiple sugar transport system substrate-binding protein